VEKGGGGICGVTVGCGNSSTTGVELMLITREDCGITYEHSGIHRTTKDRLIEITDTHRPAMPQELLSNSDHLQCKSNEENHE